MKILRLRFKNINSFYGAHPPIDFTAPPLSETGLFIITGPTGAGKSSLLDVITLALFNRVPRFDRPVSQTEIDKSGSVVNLRAAGEPRTEAYAEVEYEVRGRHYRSRWSISKNRNGNWNNYQMEIAELPSGQLLDLRRLNDFPEKNAELIGLRYEQFIKSIILAQGSFAEFLRADKNTRGKLLEDITGTYIYRTIGMAAFQKEKEWTERLKIREAELSGVQLMDEESVRATTEQLGQVQAEKSAASGQLSLWENERRLAGELDGLAARLAGVVKSKASVLESIRAFAAGDNRIRQHESVSGYVADLTRLKEYKDRLAALSGKYKEIGERRRKLASSLRELLGSGEEVTGRQVTQQHFVAAVNQFEQEVLKLQNEVNGLRAQAAPLVTAVKNEMAAADGELLKKVPLNNPSEALELLDKALEKEQEVMAGYPESFDARRRLQELMALEKNLIELRVALARRVQLSEEGKAKKDSLDQARKIIAEGEPRHQQVAAALDKISQEMAGLREKRDVELTRSTFEEQRKALKEGEPCPLCGAVHHPFVHDYVNQLISLQESIVLLEKHQAGLRNEDRDLSARLAAAARSAETCQAELASLRAQYREADLLVREISGKCPSVDLSGGEAIASEQAMIQAERERIVRWEKARETGAVVERLTRHFTALKEAEEKGREIAGQLKLLYKGPDIRAEVKTLLRKWQDWENETRSTAREAEENEGQRAEVAGRVGHLEETLSARLEKDGIGSIGEAEERILPPEEYQRLKAERKKLEDDLQALVLQEKSLLQDTDQRKGERRMPEVAYAQLESETVRLSAHVESLVGEAARLAEKLNANAENQKRFAALQAGLEQFRLQKHKWELLKKYIGDAAGNTFSNFAQSLTLSNLIGLTNLRLSRLSDRYILDKPRNDADTLFVLDTYQGNAPRAVTTLSGGESFTLSLALALALSDMASRNVRIESLFIDEGFGTLDPESLESALLTLERLQAESQKVVGVISHRFEMKDRIPVQIRVEKGEDGNSRIVVAG